MTFQRTNLTHSMPLAACAGLRARGFDMALRGLYFVQTRSQTRGGVNPKSGMAWAFISGGNAPNDSENLKGSA